MSDLARSHPPRRNVEQCASSRTVSPENRCPLREKLSSLLDLQERNRLRLKQVAAFIVDADSAPDPARKLKILRRNGVRPSGRKSCWPRSRLSQAAGRCQGEHHEEEGSCDTGRAAGKGRLRSVRFYTLKIKENL